ncbi:MAG: S-adenosylhomocysteine deaminase [Clostridia bacterium]|jgi:5-methylthioadenosine/S-adenosylhomocysteine deaminase|nr:S-adenosylhomocysteine deaminase [Clostridia bacterium]
MKTLYQPEFLYTEDTFKTNQAVLVEEDTIIEVGEYALLAEKYQGAETVKWDNLIMIPGSVNVHNHCFQSLLRGLSCDRPFLEWRDEALYKYSPRLQKQHIYGGALFAFGEMMKYGVTTVSDFFYLHNFGMESDEMIIKAAKDIGIRLVLARTMYDWNGAPQGYVETVEQAVENTRLLAQKYKDDDMVTIIPAPHSLHAASVEMIQAGHKLAKELGSSFHIHVAEEPFEVEEVQANHGGLTPVELLDKIGVVDESMVIVHGVWLKESEIKLLGDRGAKLAYCPSSNMFLADGITDIVQMMKAGVQIGLGSDGACSNNRISVFEEMRMVALLQKVKTLDAMSVNYKDAFKMGTENGGRLLELPIGKIESGYKADFVGIDKGDMSMQPISKSGEQIMPNIVYSMQPHAIKKVVVNGRLTVDEGVIHTVAESEIVKRVQQIMEEIGD